MRAQIHQPAFVSGELDPELAGRTDLQRRYYAARRLDNGVVTPKGSYRKRTGAGFIRSSKNPAKKARLIGFDYSVEQSYQIELGDLYARFYKDGGIIESPPGTPVEVAMPYTEAQLPEVWFFQSFDVLYLFHPSHAARTLTRTSHTNWVLATFAFWDGPYLSENITATTITLSGVAAGAQTMTSSAALFASTDVGRHWRVAGAAVTKIMWGTITAFTNSQSVTVDVKRAGDGTHSGALKLWRLGRFSDTTGWPRSGTFHGGRLALAGGGEPQTIAASRIGDYTVFAPSSPSDGTSVRDSSSKEFTVKDDDSWAIALDTKNAHNVLWLESAGLLFAGTPKGVFKVAADRNDAAITPTNVTARKISGAGCAPLQPIIADKNVVYAARNGRSLRRIAFRIEDGEYVSVNMSIAASHLFEKHGIAGMAFQESPFGIVWLYRDDGRLVGCTFEDNENVLAFHPHELGNAAIVESLSCIPSTAEDEVWALARHTVNGATRRDLIRLDPSFTNDKPKEDGRFLDFVLSLDNTGLLLAGSGCTLTPAATTGTNILFTAGAAVFAQADEDKERLILHRYQSGEDANRFPVYKTAAARITDYVSTTQVRCKILTAFPGTAAIAANAWRKTVEAVTGATHLIGKTVQIVGDGKVQPEKAVDGAGAIALSSPAATVHVGFAYPWRAWLLRPELQGAASMQGRRKKAIRCHIGLHRSGADGKIGDESFQDTIPFSDTSDTMDEAPPLMTGVRTVDFPGDWDRDGYVRIEQTQPVAGCVTSVTVEVEAEQ